MGEPSLLPQDPSPPSQEPAPPSPPPPGGGALSNYLLTQNEYYLWLRELVFTPLSQSVLLETANFQKYPNQVMHASCYVS
jgi:hypothetical protein